MTKRATVTLGDQVRAARIKKGLTQYQLAQDAGLRPEVISRLENGKSGSSLASLHKLAPLLGLSLDDLAPDLRKPKKKKGTKP